MNYFIFKKSLISFLDRSDNETKEEQPQSLKEEGNKNLENSNFSKSKNFEYE